MLHRSFPDSKNCIRSEPTESKCGQLVCLHMHIYMHVSNVCARGVCIFIYVSLYICMMDGHNYIYACQYVHVYIYIYISTCTLYIMYLYIYMYICIYVCIFICIMCNNTLYIETLTRQNFKPQHT